LDIDSVKVDKSIFFERKVENNTIDYRLQSIISAFRDGNREQSEKEVKTNRYSITEK